MATTATEPAPAASSVADRDALPFLIPAGAVLVGAGLVAGAWAWRRRSGIDQQGLEDDDGDPSAQRRAEVLANVGPASAAMSSSAIDRTEGLPTRTAELAPVGANGAPNGGVNGRANGAGPAPANGATAVAANGTPHVSAAGAATAPAGPSSPNGPLRLFPDVPTDPAAAAGRPAPGAPAADPEDRFRISPDQLWPSPEQGGGPARPR